MIIEKTCERKTTVIFQTATKRKVNAINGISALLQLFTVILCLHPSFTPHPVSDDVGDQWKAPVVYIACMVAAVCTGYTALATAPVWVPITGLGASGIAAATAISECFDDDCYDCDGSGCITCKPTNRRRGF